jgi:nitroimidazol reductase NimA-like FMN-containing flavoprotein (pyridoxamine 5'-phosphate oxidase superfamily)
MSALTMTVEERQSFLAGVHVGVLSVGRGEDAPLAVPVWYSYEPGGTVTVIIAPSSLKGQAIEKAGRFALCAQSEELPYKYVTVEGQVTESSPVDDEERRDMAYRYLGQEFGDLYLKATEDDAADSIVVRMTPERWRTTDYAKFG